MRIRTIKIEGWRHFTNLQLDIPHQTGLVCIVGGNGTGKSHILELIAACAHRLGLSAGIEIPRGDPFIDSHNFSLEFYLEPGVSTTVDEGLGQDPSMQNWDRTILIESKKTHGQGHSLQILAGGITDQNERVRFANQVVRQLQISKDVHFLSLDADRAYPKRSLNSHEVAAAYEIEWEGPEYTRGRSFRPTRTLYDEWLKYFFAQENQSGTKLMQGMRRAIKSGETPPIFEDHFKGYAESVQKVLPHLLFTGVDPKKRTLLFDSTGLELNFDQLSGGEREIAFLVGQIDRFGLRQGIFLLDEPELHLNADLIRMWVSYLTSTVESGQIWLATHSLEAVEAAGEHSTFVLERNESTRKVDSVARLDSRPVLSALSRAVGTPAFSISQLTFVFVEGEETLGERERFRLLAGSPRNVRFLEVGSCTEVLRRVSAIKSLAEEAKVSIRIGGILDRDFRSKGDVDVLSGESGVFVLPVHEVENLFLHPGVIAFLQAQNGHSGVTPAQLVQDAADKRAGSWIFQYAMATPNAKSLGTIAPTAKDRAKTFNWKQIMADRTAAFASVLAVSCLNADDVMKLDQILNVSAKAYERKRSENTFWKECEGKQVLSDIATEIGFAGTSALIQAVFVAFQKDSSQIPEEVTAFRKYVEAL